MRAVDFLVFLPGKMTTSFGAAISFTAAATPSAGQTSSISPKPTSTGHLIRGAEVHDVEVPACLVDFRRVLAVGLVVPIRPAGRGRRPGRACRSRPARSPAPPLPWGEIAAVTSVCCPPWLPPVTTSVFPFQSGRLREILGRLVARQIHPQEIARLAVVVADRPIVLERPFKLLFVEWTSVRRSAGRGRGC